MADSDNRVDVLSEVRRRTAERKQPRLWEMDVALALNERLQAEVERLRGELKMARQERAAAVNHANNLRPHTWQQQRQHLVDEIARLQAQLAAQAEVIEAARASHDTDNALHQWLNRTCELCAAFARLKRPASRPRSVPNRC